MSRPLIVPAPDQTPAELATVLLGLATDLGLHAGTAVSVDTAGSRYAFRVDAGVYDAWLAETGHAVASTDESESAFPSGEVEPEPSEPGAVVEGSTAPPKSSTTKQKTSGKAAR